MFLIVFVQVLLTAGYTPNINPAIINTPYLSQEQCEEALVPYVSENFPNMKIQKTENRGVIAEDSHVNNDFTITNYLECIESQMLPK